jgi:serine/threonine protein kinase
VLDFGIAKDIATSESDTSLTSPGSLIGTVNYMAPEQIRNSSRADARSDIYSLGVILYFALGGKLPYESENVADLIVKIVESKPRPLAKTNPRLPRKLAEVVMRAMSKDPKDRYESVAALALALEPHAGNAVFDEARASAAFPASVPPPREEPAPGQTTSLSSALPGELVAQRKPDSLALGRIVLLLAIGMFFLTFGGSWLLSRNEPGASGGEVPASVGLQRGNRSTVSASSDVVAPSPAEPPASGSGPDTSANDSVVKQSALAAVRRERQLTLRIHAAQQARPETPRVAAPAVAQTSPQVPAPAPSVERASDTSSFVYEKNPYLRH